jgi:hypothetical protein
MPAIMNPVDFCYIELQQAGWSVSERQTGGADGALCMWLVTASKGDQVIEAIGATQAFAWELACAKARPVQFLQKGVSYQLLDRGPEKD